MQAKKIYLQSPTFLFYLAPCFTAGFHHRNRKSNIHKQSGFYKKRIQDKYPHTHSHKYMGKKITKIIKLNMLHPHLRRVTWTVTSSMEPASPAPILLPVSPGTTAKAAGREAPVAGGISWVRPKRKSPVRAGRVPGRICWRTGGVSGIVTASRGTSAVVARDPVRGLTIGITPVWPRGREPALRPRSSRTVLGSYRRTSIHENG